MCPCYPWVIHSEDLLQLCETTDNTKQYIRAAILLWSALLPAARRGRMMTWHHTEKNVGTKYF
jgi:hypothetical protein